VVLPDVTLPEAVRQLQQALDSLTALSPSHLPDQMAVQVTTALLQVQERLQGLALRSVADMHQRDLYVTAGAPATGTWVVAAVRPSGARPSRHGVSAGRAWTGRRSPASAMSLGEASQRASTCRTDVAPDRLRRAHSPVLNRVIVANPVGL
jgi:hypothetical protein